MGGLPTSTVNGFVVNPENTNVMYVAMRDGVFVSRDAGQTWARADGPRNVASVAVDPKRPADVVAVTTDGVTWSSADAGARWQRARAPAR